MFSFISVTTIITTITITTGTLNWDNDDEIHNNSNNNGSNNNRDNNNNNNVNNRIASYIPLLDATSVTGSNNTATAATSWNTHYAALLEYLRAFGYCNLPKQV